MIHITLRHIMALVALLLAVASLVWPAYPLVPVAVMFVAAGLVLP
jgi:hypothetical protein